MSKHPGCTLTDISIEFEVSLSNARPVSRGTGNHQYVRALLEDATVELCRPGKRISSIPLRPRGHWVRKNVRSVYDAPVKVARWYALNWRLALIGSVVSVIALLWYA